MRTLGFSELSQPLPDQKFTRIEKPMLVKIVALIAMIGILFELTFWTVFSFNHWLAGFFAVAYSVTLASRRGMTGLDKAFRWASILGIGSAILARSEYWFQPVVKNFLRLLNFQDGLKVTEGLVSSSKPWVVLIIALGFLSFYWLVSQWPEMANKKLPRNALALCSVTQTVIFITCAIPSVLTITVGMLLGALFTVMINKQYTFMSFAIATISAPYALTNLPAFFTLLGITGIVLAYMLYEYKPVGILRACTQAVMTFSLLGPICWLSGKNEVFDCLTIAAFTGLVFYAQFLPSRADLRAVSLMTTLIGLWYSVLALPMAQLLFITCLAIFLSLSVVAYAKNFHEPLWASAQTVSIGFVIFSFCPFYGLTFGEAGLLSFAAMAILVLITCLSWLAHARPEVVPIVKTDL